MADNPRDEIPGARSRFKFGQETGYAFFGPLIALVIVVVVGLYVLLSWKGEPGGIRIDPNRPPAATKPDAPPKNPSAG